jgi:hypothetical protein
MAEEQNPQPEEVKQKKEKKIVDLSKGSLVWTIWHFVEAVLLITGGILAIAFSATRKSRKSFIRSSGRS